MLQTSLLLMKSLSKTETPIFFICSVLFPKAIFLDIYLYFKLEGFLKNNEN